MSNNYFQFKRFRIGQEGSAMKVGTDGVLLGAWCRVEPGQARLLDIGTGTCVIALMLVQRLCGKTGRGTNAEVGHMPDTDAGKRIPGGGVSGFGIDALEIDPDSCLQAERNVADSPWPERVRIIRRSLQSFAAEPGNRGRYDHIISNPPYFVDSLLSPDAARTTARHTASLTFAELAAGVDVLLSPDGIFSVVLPPAAAKRFIAEATGQGLFLLRRTEVFSKPGVLPKRVLMEFGRKQGEVRESALVVSDRDHPSGYSAEYRALTGDFYLKF